ncbi:unnamed protein product, partial [Discosporangium mesarthrocarpum]
MQALRADGDAIRVVVQLINKFENGIVRGDSSPRKRALLTMYQRDCGFFAISLRQPVSKTAVV